MTHVLIILASAVAMVGAPPPSEVSIPIVGRDDAAVKADIRKAAAEVCRDALSSGILGAMEEHRCQRRVIAQAEAKLAKLRAANAPLLARNTPAK